MLTLHMETDGWRALSLSKINMVRIIFRLENVWGIIKETLKFESLRRFDKADKVAFLLNETVQVKHSTFFWCTGFQWI